MRAVFIAGFAAVVVVAGVVFALQPSRVNAASTITVDAPSVSVTGGSEDARESFSFRMYQPWADAPHRVIVVDAVAIESSGFVSHAYVHANDTATEESFTAGGPRYQMIVRRNVPSWGAVQSDRDLTVIVEAAR